MGCSKKKLRTAPKDKLFLACISVMGFVMDEPSAKLGNRIEVSRCLQLRENTDHHILYPKYCKWI